MKFNVVVPNLDRRQDRWYFCLGWLRARGFPDENIARFSAHDGNDYTTHDDARVAAMKQFPNSVYLNQNVAKHYYCWNWTWYDIMDTIARESDELPPTLVLIDDWMMEIDYDAIVKHVSGLYSMEQPFHILQYAHSTSEGSDYPTNRENRRTVLPNIQHGVAGTGEAALLVSPRGARRLVEYADVHPQHAPEILMWHFSVDGDNSGCYSAIENEAHCIGYAGYSQFQDRCTPTGGKHVKYEPDGDSGDPRPNI